MSVKLFKIEIKNNKKVSKDDLLENVKNLIEEKELEVNYDKYIEYSILWVIESPSKIAQLLEVKKIVPQGAFIRGLLGGEKKLGKEKYAGLVIEEYEEENDMVYLKLTGLSKTYGIPKEILKNYGVNVYRVFYMGLINPFKCNTYKILLSSFGEQSLKEFLKKFVELNEQNIVENDRRKINELIKELKMSIDQFDPKESYVIYRCARAFTACVPTDLSNAVSESHISYIICRNKEQAYFYAAALNYLAYKVVQYKRGFIRSQFAKPLIALLIAGITWKDVAEPSRSEIVKQSMILTEKLSWKKYSNQKTALTDIAKVQEFMKIIELFDNHVSKFGFERLEEALRLVSAMKEEAD